VTKYRAIPTEVDGIRFDSKKEARHYQELKIRKRAHVISQLELQPRFKLHVRGQLICTYIADFAYFDVKSQQTVVEDVKGVLTPVYKLKKKLMRAVHGIEIQEV